LHEFLSPGRCGIVTEMIAQCAICGAENEVEEQRQVEAAEPPDFDTRPGEPLRSTLPSWVACCRTCNYCAADISVAHAKAHDEVQSDAYRSILNDTYLPLKARHFLCYACLLDRIHEYADAGWTALHAAWACDDIGDSDSGTRCREQAIEYWKRGKHAGLAFSDDLASEYALVTDVHRRMGQFELAQVTCSEALDIEDLPPVIEHVLRRQKVLIEQHDTAAHSLRELVPSAPH
jgi:hypothetical protein